MYRLITPIIAVLVIANSIHIVEDPIVDYPIKSEPMMSVVEEIIVEEEEHNEEEEILSKIDELDEIKDNKREYLMLYKQLCSEYGGYFGEPITIFDVFTDEEIYLMCRCVETETYQCPFDAKVDVATVVINRIESNKYPNNVKEVIVPGQFAFWRTEISEDTLEAIEYAYLFGVPELKESLYFQSLKEMETFCGKTLKHYDGYHWFY